MNKMQDSNFTHEDHSRWLGTDADSWSADLKRHLHLTLGRDQGRESHLYLFEAAALTVRDALPMVDS